MAPGPDLAFHFRADLSELPPTLDLVLLTTGAGPRKAIAEALFAHHTIGAIVFEKFLFQTIADHRLIGDLLREKAVPAWVNTPRRYWPSYRSLADSLKASGPITMVVTHDPRHGLATNLIHLLDLLAFLAGDQQQYQLGGRELILNASASRHAGMVEFSGHLYGYSERGDVLVVRPAPKGQDEGRIELLVDGSYITIDEGRQCLTRFGATGTAVSEPFVSVFQSQLTHIIAEDILLRGSCLLPDYATSARLHVECLRAFLEAMGYSRNAEDRQCPVT